MRKCAVIDCHNNDVQHREKRFFSVPTDHARRALWIYATGKDLSCNTKFVVCQDHFDVMQLKVDNKESRMLIYIAFVDGIRH